MEYSPCPAERGPFGREEGRSARNELRERRNVVSSTLFLHHFDAASVAALLCESARVARFAVVALDLTRHRVPMAVNALLSRLAYRSPITRLDARASVLQAWTISELRAIAARALPGTLVRPAGPFIQGLLWKRT